LQIGRYDLSNFVAEQFIHYGCSKVNTVQSDNICPLPIKLTNELFYYLKEADIIIFSDDDYIKRDYFKNILFRLGKHPLVIIDFYEKSYKDLYVTKLPDLFYFHLKGFRIIGKACLT
jgi:hypothetical protein